MITKDSNPRGRAGRRALLAVAAVALGTVSPRAEAQTTYRWQISNGATIAGVSTNWSEACGTNVTVAPRVTTMTAAAFACSGSSVRITSAAGNVVMVTMVGSTAYAAATAISGGSFITMLRNGTGSNALSADFQLGYVGAGAFTGFGTPVVQAMTTTATAYTIDLSNQTGTVPAGGALALRIRKVQAVSDQARVYFGSNNGNAGTLTVTEAAAGTLTLGDGSAPAAPPSPVCAAPAVATYIDHFTLLASAATNVTAIGTTFSADPAGLLAELAVTNDAGALQAPALASPAGLNPVVSGLGFAAPTGTAAQHRLRVTPNAATTSSGTFTARVTGVTTSGGFGLTGTDGTSATVTIDGAASPDVTGAAATSGNGTVTASWTNPAAGTVPATDFGGYVVVLGNTVPVTNTPAKGTAAYTANGTIGSDLVVCTGSIATCQRSGLGPNQPYYLKVFTRDGCANWSAGVEVTATTPNVTTTIADGTNPAAASRAPGGLEAPLDTFTLQSSAGSTDTVTAVTVTLSAGTYAGLSSIRLMSGSACTGTQYGPTVAPTADAVTFSGTGIPVTSTATSFYVCVTPRSHAAMPPPPGAAYSVTGTVTAWTSTNAQLGTDAGSGTVTIDNASSPDVTAASATSAATSVTASWTNPGAGVAPATDFGSYVVVLGNTVPVTNAPAEGTTSYTANGTNSIGADLIVCAGNVATCQRTGLAAGQTYHLKIFTRDTAGNWSPGVAVFATTLDARTTPVSLAATAPSCSLVDLSALYTGDTPVGDNTVTFARGAGAAGPFTNLAACTNLGGGANPRTCSDGTVSPSTTYYYRATFSDADGIVGGASLDSGAVTVPACAPALAVGAGAMPAAANVTAGSSGTIVGRLVLTATSDLTVTSIAVANAGTAVAGADVSSLALYDDTTGAFVGQATWNPAASRYVVAGLALGVPSASPVTLRVVIGLNVGAAAGRTFAMRVLVPGDVTVAAPSMVSNTATLSGNTFTVVAGAVAGSTNVNAPMISIINPASGAVVSPNDQYKVQIRVFNPTTQGGVAGIVANSVRLSTDGGATFPATCPGAFCATQNTRYDSGAPTVTGTVYEVIVAGQAPGGYTLRARVSNGAVANVLSEPVQISVASANRGDGNLLVRDNSAQLCSDCHALQTHSSEAVGTKYGSWAATCRDCHAPHGTRNVKLVRESVTPPTVNGVQTAKNVGFVRATGDSNAAGWDGAAGRPTATGSYVNSDSTGPCQVCHTRTQSGGGLARWRNTGNADAHYTAAAGTQACTNCHAHGNGFGGGESTGGAICSGCHAAIRGMMAGTDGAGTGSQPSKHSLVGFADSASDVVPAAGDWASAGVATLDQIPAAQRSCVNMCHADHPHDLTSPALATHDNNLYLDPSTQATRGNGAANRTSTFRVKTDFDPTANGGMCTKCHSKPIAAGRTTVTDAAYGASAHDFTSTSTPAFTWQYTLHDGGTTQRNCTKCHASRTEGTTPGVSGTGVTAVHGTGDPSLLAGTKNPAGTAAGFVCYNCHGSAAAPAAGAQGNRSNKDIQTQIAKARRHPADADAVHDSAAEYANAAFGNTLGVTGRHSSCMDCHEPHRARAGTHAVTTNLAGPPLEGAWGAQLSTNPAFWAAPAAGNFTKKVIVAGADAEATLCFKCHSSYYGTLPTAPSGAYTETDTAREFNPANAGSWYTTGTTTTWTTGETAGGFHPVLAAAGNNLGAVNMANLVTTNFAWRTTGARNLMTCTDCHESESAADPNGPHGSTAGFILRGPNTGWSQSIVLNSTTLPAGTFCLNCHSSAFTNSRYPDHARNDHWPVPCWNCHARVPHGGPRPGMLVAGAGAGGNVGGVIAGWDQTAPYWGGTTTDRLYILSYPQGQTTAWVKNNCGCNGSGH